MNETGGATVADAGPRRAPICIRGLIVVYEGAGRRVVAVRDLSLDVAAGELAALAGPNGSGKTTLVRALTGAVRPLAGEAWLCGDDARSLSYRELARRVAVVPQEPVLPEGFTALDAVLMGRTPHLRLLEREGPADVEAARRAMLATGTWDFATTPVGGLSGGERQRVVVARALAQETPVLLLDEPTAHLDIGHQASILGLVRSLCRSEGKAVLAVVHDLTLAAQYADRLVLLDAGVTVAEGPAEDVLRADLLGRVYGTRVDVFSHPETGKPVVAPRAPAGAPRDPG